MIDKIKRGLRLQIEKTFPERRLFLRSDTETRYLRISPATQLIAVTGSAAVIAWTIMATAIIFMDALGAGSLREQALREQQLYEERLNTLSAERDERRLELAAAHDRFTKALAEVSAMQARLLQSEERRNEAETGLEVTQAKLRDALRERDQARENRDVIAAQLAAETETIDPAVARARDIGPAVDFLSAQLAATARERDELAANAKAAEDQAEELIFEAQLAEERNERIFTQLEEAVSISLTPLDEMFKAADLPADSIIDTVRRGYSGQGGPLEPLSFSTKGAPPDEDSVRANGILERLDELNIYRIAVENLPFSEPLKGSFRFTSGFGMRNDPLGAGRKMHAGSDFAGPYGMPVHTTANGTVTFAGWQSGYGRLVKIKHDFGIETRYAHLARIRVSVGDRVSRGDQIGDMGNSGRSTGTHLHYEVRIDGDPVNPMKYIKAARDVF